MNFILIQSFPKFQNKRAREGEERERGGRKWKGDRMP